MVTIRRIRRRAPWVWWQLERPDLWSIDDPEALTLFRAGELTPEDLQHYHAGREA